METEDIQKGYYNSPIGLVEILGTEHYLTSVKFVEKGQARKSPPFVIEKCIRQLDEYFLGKRQEFGLELKMEGTEFQKQVWQELSSIKFAKTISYIDLAKRLNQPLAVRAIGTANGKNPFCIIYPCHRVIGSNGQLIGYAGGLKRKQWLLEHERKCVGNYQLSLF
jgi:methylated-DNA-[protein]-cysteine S-methyltransferase